MEVECKINQVKQGIDNAYILKQPGYDIYGHWLLDIVPRLRTIEIYQNEKFSKLIVNSVNEWQSSILNLFAIPDVFANDS